jgi:hypothetical protein
MERLQRNSGFGVAGAALWLSLSASAFAGQPLGKMAAQMAHQAQIRSVQSAIQLPANRLDLRPPPPAPSSESSQSQAFPSAIHHDLGFTVGNKSLPTLGSGATGRVMSKPEELARNFRREGLPVAKLWQNHDALVHIGLSPRGKPGLWLVQKLH